MSGRWSKRGDKVRKRFKKEAKLRFFWAMMGCEIGTHL